MPPYEYSVGDRVRGDDDCGGRVTFADPVSGGLVLWDDEIAATEYTWSALGRLQPDVNADEDEPSGAGADPYGRPDPHTHPEFWTE